MRRTGSLVAAAALLAVSTPVWASVAAAPAAQAAGQAAGQAAAPAVQAAPVSELINEVDIPYTKFTLDNGLTVLVHEDHKAPVVAVSVWYNVGSKDEPAGKTGFAHLFEHLMFGGSENAPGSYFTPMRNMGATDMNGTTWFDRTNYFETVPTPALEQALSASFTDPSLFRSGWEFAAFLSLVPRQNSSGGKDRLGRISKMGDGYLRKLLVVGATSVIRRVRPSPATAVTGELRP